MGNREWKAEITADVDGIRATLDLTGEYLEYVCEHVDPQWVAGVLLQNDAVRQTIIDVLSGRNFLSISTGKSFDSKFRDELISTAKDRNYKDLAHRLERAIVTAEKYQRAYWDWYHSGRPIHESGGYSIPKTTGPEFMPARELADHDWPRVRKEIEEKVLSAITDARDTGHAETNR